MKKFNFLSKAALLVAPFAVVATLGAANAHADSTPANATDMQKQFLQDSKDANAKLAYAIADAKDTTKQNTTINTLEKLVNAKDSSLFDATGKTTDGSKLDAMSDKDTNDTFVTKAVNNITFYANRAKNVDKGNVTNLQFAANQVSGLVDQLNLVQESGVNVDSQLATANANAKVVNDALNVAKNPTKPDMESLVKAMRNDIAKQDFVAYSKDVTALDQLEANAKKDADFNDYLAPMLADQAQVEAEAKAAANKAAKKPAKKHARKHARKFAIRVKAHKIYAYKSANFRRHAGRKAEKRGKKLNVYGVIKKGHKTYYRVFGHRVITANKHFVKRV